MHRAVRLAAGLLPRHGNDRPGEENEKAWAPPGRLSRSPRQQRNLDLTLQAFRDYQHGVRPSGSGARELLEFFATVDGQLTRTAPNDPMVLASDREVLNLLSKRPKQFPRNPKD